MGSSLAKQLMSPLKIFVINKVSYIDFLISWLHTVNILSLSLKNVGDDLGCKCNNIKKYGEREVLQNYQYKGTGFRKETIYFHFRMNIVQRDSYQAYEIVIES